MITLPGQEKGRKKGNPFEVAKEGLVGRTEQALVEYGFAVEIADGRMHDCPCCGKKKFKISDRHRCIGGCNTPGCNLNEHRFASVIDLATGSGKFTAREALRIAQQMLAGEKGIAHSRPGQQKLLASNSRTNPKKKTKRKLADDGFSDHPQTIKLSDKLNKNMASQFCRRKNLSLEVFEACGGRTGQWQLSREHQVNYFAGIPIYSGPELKVCNWAIYPWSKAEFWKGCSKTSAFGSFEDEDPASDRVGICCSIKDREILLAGKPRPDLRVIKTEGVSDFLKVREWMDSASEPTLVWTNSDGAYSTLTKADGAEWFFPMLRRLTPKLFCVLHDRDEAGVAGAIKWTNILSRPTLEVWQ